MDESKALDIVMRLADGVDPRTGAPLPAESPYQDPETIRALFMAVLALKYQQKYKKNDRADPERDGPAKRT
jgi:hypothetical protein